MKFEKCSAYENMPNLYSISIEWSLSIETFDISAGLLSIPGKQGFINAIEN